MATLIQSYEQQYSVLTADITAKIGRLKSNNEENREQVIKEIQANFEEAYDLLEQLELETRGSGAGAGARLPAYRAELLRVREEYRTVLTGANALETDDVYEEWSGASEQRQKLLDNSERLERIVRDLTEGARLAVESEEVGAAVLRDLAGQRDTLQRSRGRLRETDEQLNRSSRLMNTMIVRALQDRLVLVLVFIVLFVLACTGIYISLT